MSTQFRPLEIPPGVVAKPTKQMESSQWAEVNMMRWVEGQLSPIGGQSQYAYTFASPCRAIHSWYDLNSVFHIAYLCESNLYIDTGGTLADVTPTSGITAPAPNVDGDYSAGFYSDGPYSGAGPIPTIDNIPDAWSLDNFGAVLLAMTSPDGRLLQWDPSLGVGVVFTDPAFHAFAAGSTTVNMTDANPGSVLPGMSVFNQTSNLPIGVVLTYSAAGVLTLAAPALNPGAADDVLAFTNVATPVVADTGRGIVPTGRCFVVTAERFVMMFGASDPTNGGGFRRFAWSDQENPGAWDYSNVTSQAGFLDIEPASPIITCKSTPQGTLFWTAAKCYLSSFLGLPYIYNYVEVAKNCTPWSPQSIVSTTVLTLWMSQQGLFSFNGAWVAPMPCAIRPWIDDDIDLFNVRNQACAVNVANFNEFWWFFPQDGQTTNTRCMIFNYKENWFSQGQMARSAGISASYATQTVMANGVFAYQHELGDLYPDGTPLPWAETFDLNLNSGSRLTTLKQMIPDIDGDVNNLRYSVYYRMSRSVMPDANGNPIPVVELQTPPRKVNASNGFVDFRTTGRDMRLRIMLAGPQVLPVTVGQHLVDSVARGDR